MQGSVKERFTFSYESEAAASYLVINPGSDEQIIDYQVEMISNNPNTSILPIAVRRKDSTVKLYYNITSKQSLSNILKRKLDRNEFINIMINITKIILESKNYFLSDNGFIMDDEFIFLNPQTNEVSLVYLPIQNNTDANESFKSFLIKLAVYWADVIYTDDNLIQRILSSTKNESFNILGFNKLLNGLKAKGPESKKEIYHESSRNASQNSVEKSEENNLNSDMRNTNSANTDNSKSSFQSNIISTSRIEPPVINIPGNTAPKVDIPRAEPKPKALPTKKQQNVCTGNTTVSNSISGIPRNTFLIVGAAVQILILAVSGVIAVKMGGESSGEDKVTTYSAIFVAAAGASFLMWKKVLEKMKTALDSSGNKVPGEKAGIKSKNVINMDKFEYKKININHAEYGADCKNGLKDVSGSSNYNDTTCLSDYQSTDPRYEDTVLLGCSKESFPVLKSVENGVTDTVEINKSSFIIGRMKEQVDYVVGNNTVGKVHAEIFSKNGIYFIKDLNSRNGTYINGERIESNREYQLRNADRIAFSDTEFTFVIP